MGEHLDCGRYLSLAVEIIHATGGDTKRADEAAAVIAAKIAPDRATIEALVGALEKISAIENQEFGGDWDEIEQARAIARSALLLARGSAGNE